MAINLSRPTSGVLCGGVIESVNCVKYGEVSKDEGGKTGEVNGIEADFSLVGENPPRTSSIQHEFSQLGASPEHIMKIVDGGIVLDRHI